MWKVWFSKKFNSNTLKLEGWKVTLSLDIISSQKLFMPRVTFISGEIEQIRAFIRYRRFHRKTKKKKKKKKKKKEKKKERGGKKLVLFHSYPDDCVYVTFIDDRFFNFPHSSSHCDHSLAVYSCIKPERISTSPPSPPLCNWFPPSQLLISATMNNF